MQTTNIYVKGSGSTPDAYSYDTVWSECWVDDNPHKVSIRVTVRKRDNRDLGKHSQTLPIAVYLNGGNCLYPTYVYEKETNELLAVDFGVVYIKNASVSDDAE